ncbi:MAG: SHOCT domain-containing protein [Planctomycetota bacterium]
MSQLRTRRERIDKRLIEIAEPVGVSALSLGAPVHGTKVVDIDRIVKKIDRIENDISDAEKLTEPRSEGFLKALGQDLARISDRFAARELHQKRDRLIAELGLALLACEYKVVRERQPEVGALLEKHREDARTVDDLFRQARLVDEELDRRAKDGRLHKEPKAIEKLLSKTGEVVGDASDAAKDKIVDLSKTAAKTAVKQSGKAVWSLAKGAFKLGQRKLTGDDASDEDAVDEDSDSDERPKKKAKSRRSDDESDEAPSKKDVPELIRQLAKLHKDGVLTDEEFAKKKAELLKRL